jgi:hypothetical protein
VAALALGGGGRHFALYFLPLRRKGTVGIYGTVSARPVSQAVLKRKIPFFPNQVLLGLEDLLGQVVGIFVTILHAIEIELFSDIYYLLQFFFGANHEAHVFPYVVSEVVEILDIDGVINEPKFLQSAQQKTRCGFCH